MESRPMLRSWFIEYDNAFSLLRSSRRCSSSRTTRSWDFSLGLNMRTTSTPDDSEEFGCGTNSNDGSSREKSVGLSYLDGPPSNLRAETTLFGDDRARGRAGHMYDYD